MSKRGVLLVNTGSPDSPAVKDVRRYLREFLMDGRVIDLPYPVRFLIAHLIVMLRARLSAEAYKRIWTVEGAPLVTTSRRVQALLQARLDFPVGLGMRYGQPSLASAVDMLKQRGVDKILIIPMFPHYAMSSYETAAAKARKVLASRLPDAAVSVNPPFYDRPEYVRALVLVAQPHLKEGFDHLLLSFHGLPERHIRKSDPTRSHCLRRPDCCGAEVPAIQTCYRAQCLRTAKAFVAEARLPVGSHSIAFQSRMGPDKWLEPATFEVIERLGRAKTRRLLVMCPSFVADCLETIDEIGVRGRQVFRAAGGGELVMIPCLNGSPAWIDVLQQMASAW